MTSPPAISTLDRAQALNDEAFYEFCVTRPNGRFERTSLGDIIILPLDGLETSHRSLDAASQLHFWAEEDGRGKGLGVTEFVLPSRAAYSPDAAWLSNERLAKLTRQQRRKFPPVCPEFVIEMMCPSDRLKAAKDKMLAWMAEGVELGWLIDGDRETVYIYRAGSQDPEKRTGITILAGEGPVAGFVLNLTRIWAGL